MPALSAPRSITGTAVYFMEGGALAVLLALQIADPPHLKQCVPVLPLREPVLPLREPVVPLGRPR